MINYGTHTRHVIAEHDVRKAFAPLRAFFERCTNCQGAFTVDDDRYERTPLPFDALTAHVDALATAEIPGHTTLFFLFFLTRPGTAELLSRDADRLLWRSNLRVTLRPRQTSELTMVLTWPFDDATPAFLESHDAVFESLRVVPKASAYDRDGAPWAFDRGGYEALPVDPLGRTLHEAILVNPLDEGARIAYADWLSERGDPLGEALVLQVEIARAEAPFRAADLQRRLAALIREHGLKWSRVLVPR